MRSQRSLFAASVLMGLCCWGAAQAQDAKPGVESSPASGRLARGSIVTMYALDPLARAFCFRDGGEGLTIVKNRVGNRCSDLSFTTAGGGSLVTGIEANRVGAIIDLGTADELRERYGYDDADSGGEGFASLRLQGEKIFILKEDRPQEKLQPLREGPSLFTNVGPSANAPIKLGHIYLVRIMDMKDSSFDLIAKVIVVGYTPNESVTLRWALL